MLGNISVAYFGGDTDYAWKKYQIDIWREQGGWYYHMTKNGVDISPTSYFGGDWYGPTQTEIQILGVAGGPFIDDIVIYT